MSSIIFRHCYIDGIPCPRERVWWPLPLCDTFAIGNILMGFKAKKSLRRSLISKKMYVFIEWRYLLYICNCFEKEFLNIVEFVIHVKFGFSCTTSHSVIFEFCNPNPPPLWNSRIWLHPPSLWNSKMRNPLFLRNSKMPPVMGIWIFSGITQSAVSCVTIL